jgi:coenzyme F420-dependent glucose-6-phosphate dehydrogenase
VELAVHAEDRGFDSVWVSDHLQPWRHSDGHAPFSLSWLAAAGERTQRVELGTSVLTPTFRYHPVVVAQAFGTLGCLYPGRLRLGVGTGEAMNEVPLGVEWPEFRERFRRLRESIDLIRKLWSEPLVDFDGEYYRARGATIYDRPAEAVPIFVAAGGQVAARYAGRSADGFICTSGKGEELYRDTLLPAVREGAEAEGRDFDAIEKMIEVKVSFDTDPERALADTRIWAALALPADDKAGVHDPREMERRAAAVADQAHERFLVSTDPEQHVEQLRPYLELGFRHLVFHAPGHDQRRFLDLYAADVLPRLRREWS